MPRLYTPTLQKEKNITLTGENAKIITSVLRLSPNDTLELFDGKGTYSKCSITSITKNSVKLQLLEIKRESPSRHPLHLFQSLPKNETFERLIRQCTELGVDEITPFTSQRTVAKITPKTAPKKIERWNKIAIEACRQCGRNYLPKIHAPTDFNTAMKKAATKKAKLFFWEESKEKNLIAWINANKKPPDRAAVIIGPEGGFSKEEANKLKNMGFTTLSLGPRLLKVDTAAALAVGIIKIFMENR